MIAVLECARLSAWTSTVRAEYEEMPGLSLTKQQMQRLWGLDGAACDAVLTVLVATHVLRRLHDGRYVGCYSAAC